jgi:hypothetical protein
MFFYVRCSKEIKFNSENLISKTEFDDFLNSVEIKFNYYTGVFTL